MPDTAVAPRYKWLPGAARYYDFGIHRFVSSAVVRSWMWRSVATALDPVNDLSDAISMNALSVADWQTAMRQLIKEAVIAQYVLGHGGLATMTQADWGSIGGVCAEQYRWLDGFAADIAAGKLSPKQIAARARMYIRSSQEAFWRATVNATGMPPLPALPGDGSSKCLCVTTPESRVLTTRGWVPMQDVIVGDLVWTHRSRWRRVTACIVKPSQPYHRQALIVAPTGATVGATHDHLWWTDRGWRSAVDIDNSVAKMYTCNYENILSTVRNASIESQSTQPVQNLSVGLPLWKSQGFPGRGMHDLCETQTSGGRGCQLADARGAGEELGWSAGCRRGASDEIRGYIGRDGLADQEGRSSLDMVLAGRGRSEAHDLSVSVALDQGARADSARSHDTSHRYGCLKRCGRQFGMSLASESRGATRRDTASGSLGSHTGCDLRELRDGLQAPSSRSLQPVLLDAMPGCLPEVALQGQQADLQVRDMWQGVPSANGSRHAAPLFTGVCERSASEVPQGCDVPEVREDIQRNSASRQTSSKILFTELPPGTPLYDIAVEEDHSFVLEGLIAHNTNDKCYWSLSPIVRTVNGRKKTVGWDCRWKLRWAKEHCDSEAMVMGRNRTPIPHGCIQRASLWNPLTLWLPGREPEEGYQPGPAPEDRMAAPAAKSYPAPHTGNPGHHGGSKPRTASAASLGDTPADEAARITDLLIQSHGEIKLPETRSFAGWLAPDGRIIKVRRESAENRKDDYASHVTLTLEAFPDAMDGASGEWNQGYRRMFGLGFVRITAFGEPYAPAIYVDFDSLSSAAKEQLERLFDGVSKNGLYWIFQRVDAQSGKNDWSVGVNTERSSARLRAKTGITVMEPEVKSYPGPGHRGRPGKVGGSKPRAEGAATATAEPAGLDRVYTDHPVFGRETVGEFLARNELPVNADGTVTLYHARPKTAKFVELKAGSLLEKDPEKAAHYAGRDRGLQRDQVEVLEVRVPVDALAPGVFIATQRALDVRHAKVMAKRDAKLETVAEAERADEQDLVRARAARLKIPWHEGMTWEDVTAAKRAARKSYTVPAVGAKSAPVVYDPVTGTLVAGSKGGTGKGRGYWAPHIGAPGGRGSRPRGGETLLPEAAPFTPYSSAPNPWGYTDAELATVRKMANGQPPAYGDVMPADIRDALYQEHRSGMLRPADWPLLITGKDQADPEVVNAVENWLLLAPPLLKQAIWSIDLHTGPGPAYDLPGYGRFTAFANWSSRDGGVNVFEADSKARARLIENSLTHEAGHAVFDWWSSAAYAAEAHLREQWNSSSWPAWWDDNGPGSWAQLQQHIDEIRGQDPFLASKLEWDRDNGTKKGISAYSTAWGNKDEWAGRSETFAELSEGYFHHAFSGITFSEDAGDSWLSVLAGTEAVPHRLAGFKELARLTFRKAPGRDSDLPVWPEFGKFTAPKSIREAVEKTQFTKVKSAPAPQARRSGRGRGYWAPHRGRPGAHGGSAPRGEPEYITEPNVTADNLWGSQVSGNIRAASDKTVRAALAKVPEWARGQVKEVKVVYRNFPKRDPKGERTIARAWCEVGEIECYTGGAKRSLGPKPGGLYIDDVMAHEVAHVVYHNISKLMFDAQPDGETFKSNALGKLFAAWMDAWYADPGVDAYSIATYRDSEAFSQLFAWKLRPDQSRYEEARQAHANLVSAFETLLTETERRVKDEHAG